jgi:2'-5' RNA ligase
MITIASLFDKKASTQTSNVWDLLERECDLTGIKTIPYPHFSWFTAGKITDPVFNEILLGLSNQLKSFTIQTTGLGIFTGQNPIIYLPLVKTLQLISYHVMIWEALSSRVFDMNPYYATENWVPHITIGYGDVTTERLSCAVRNLALHNLSLNITINNLAYLSRIEEEAKIEFIVKLQK